MGFDECLYPVVGGFELLSVGVGGGNVFLEQFRCFPEYGDVAEAD